MTDHTQTQTGRTATVDDEDFEVTALHGGRYTSRHLFRADEDTALCGHPSTASHVREDADTPHLTQASAYCKSCRRTLLSERFDYVSTDDTWNALGDLEKHDVVRVEFADAEPVEGVVTRPDDGETRTKRVSLTTDYWTFGPHRDDDTHIAFSHAEGEETTFRRGLVNSEAEGRDVTSVEVLRQLDPTERDDPAERREVRERCEQWAADLYRRSEQARGDDRLTMLRLFNAAVRLGDAAAKLRDGAPLAHVEQKWRAKVELYADESPRDHDDPEDAAKRRGKHAGGYAVVVVLDAVLSDENDSDDEDDASTGDMECENECTDGDDGRAMTDGGQPQTPTMSRQNNQTDFGDFGGGAPDRTKKPPIVPITNTSIHLTADGDSAGHIAESRHRGRVYYSNRAREDHYFVKYSGYAISNTILNRLRDEGVRRVIIYERDTMDIYEFELRQYQNGYSIPSGEHPPGDPQTLVKDDDAAVYWPDEGDPKIDKRGSR